MNVALDGRLCEKTFRIICLEYRYILAAGEPRDQRKREPHVPDSQREGCRSLLMNSAIFSNLIREYERRPPPYRSPSPQIVPGAVPVDDPGAKPGPKPRSPTPKPGKPPKAPANPPAQLTRNPKVTWSASYKVWMQALDQDLAAAKAANPNFWEAEEEWLLNESVQAGIEAVWGALYHYGGPKYFMTDTFMQQFGRSKWDPTNASSAQVCGSDRTALVMAIHGHGTKFKTPTPQQQYTSHHVLVVAQKQNPKDPVQKHVPYPVKLTLYDSLKDNQRNRAVFNIAGKLAENSGWLRVDPTYGIPDHQPVKIASETLKSVPQQSVNAVCGLHAILNSWAFMLGIPIVETTRSRRKKTSNDLFNKEAAKLVTAAVAGLLQLPLIQAFFNHNGYSTAVFEQTKTIVTPTFHTYPIDPQQNQALAAAHRKHKKKFPGGNVSSGGSSSDGGA